MDSRVLLRIAAPLALTFILGGVEVFGVSAPVRYSVLAAMTLAWLVYAWTVLRHGGRPRSGNQTDQLNELRAFVNAEVQGSRVEIERTRGLIRESVAKLGGSFEAVNRASRRQGEVVARLIDRSGEGDNGGAVDVYRFALHASRQMEQLVEALEAVGDQNGITVAHIDAMAGNLQEIFALLEHVESIADETQRLALNATTGIAAAGEAGVDFVAAADEMRELSGRAVALNVQLRKLVPRSKESIARVRDAVDRIATRDLDRSCCARVEAATMLKRVDSINCGLSHGMREIAACGSAIDGSVADAVRLLQFEDIAAQSLSAASVHLERLGAINHDATTWQELLDRSSAHGDAGMGHAPGRFGQRRQLKPTEWERPPHKPVRQPSMDAGSVEIF